LASRGLASTGPPSATWRSKTSRERDDRDLVSELERPRASAGARTAMSTLRSDRTRRSTPFIASSGPIVHRDVEGLVEWRTRPAYRSSPVSGRAPRAPRLRPRAREVIARALQVVADLLAGDERDAPRAVGAGQGLAVAQLDDRSSAVARVAGRRVQAQHRAGRLGAGRGELAPRRPRSDRSPRARGRRTLVSPRPAGFHRRWQTPATSTPNSCASLIRRLAGTACVGLDQVEVARRDPSCRRELNRVRLSRRRSARTLAPSRCSRTRSIPSTERFVIDMIYCSTGCHDYRNIITHNIFVDVDHIHHPQLSRETTEPRPTREATMTTNLSDHSACTPSASTDRPSLHQGRVDRLRGTYPIEHTIARPAPAGSGSCCTARTTVAALAR